jgi:hypothetical protein
MFRYVFLPFFVSFLLWALGGCVSLTGGKRPGVAIPDRPSSAVSGSEFARKIDRYSVGQRELAILEELKKGNVPDFLRDFVPVALKGKRGIKATVWVAPDYLAIGNDSDFVRFPMNPITAQRVADQFKCVLPTKKLVDIIYRSADVKLSPSTLRPDKSMVQTSQWLKHHQLIEAKMHQSDHGRLVAGHKKDVVISNRLRQNRARVAIYGWHRKSGKAIQPLSTIHGNHYADYSHGIRLIASLMQVNGKWVQVSEVLSDPELVHLLSDEGPIRQYRYETEGVEVRTDWAFLDVSCS